MFRKIILGLLLIIFAFTLLSAQEVNTIVTEKKAPYRHTISTDPLMLIFGSPNFNYELRVTRNIAVSGFMGFGKLLFVDITKNYGAYVKGYFGSDPYSGLFLQGGITDIGIEVGDEKAEAFYTFVGGGYRTTRFYPLAVEVFSGLLFSGDEKVSFEEVSGKITKTVDIGGPVRYGGSITLGFCF
jgi:hypothetical protein